MKKLFAKIKKTLRTFSQWVEGPESKKKKSKRKSVSKKVRKKQPAKKIKTKKIKKAAKIRQPKTKPKAVKKLPTVVKKTKPASAKPEEKLVGAVTHYYPKVKAAAVLIQKEPLRVHDKILIVGKKASFRQTVSSLQINRIPIEEGRKGEEVGIQTKKEVAEGDQVYKV